MHKSSSPIAATDPLVLALPGSEAMARGLQESLQAGTIEACYVRLADGELRVLLEGDLRARRVVLVAGLERPEDKFLRLAFVADRLRDLGAGTIVLVAPYLPYRGHRDDRSQGDEVVESTFASLVSALVDGVVTLSACGELARYLPDSYHIETREAPVAPAIGEWIARHVRAPVLVARSPAEKGWVNELSRHSGAPACLAAGERPVDRTRTPVLVAERLRADPPTVGLLASLRSAGHPPPVGLSVHALFGPGDASAFLDAGFARIVTTNSIRDPTNEIDLGPILARSVRELLA